MIVFYSLIGIILTVLFLIIVVIIFSSITVELKKLKIDDIDKITTIIDAGIKKQYDCIIENIDILIKIKINIFNILPITIFKIDNKKIKTMLLKTKKKKPVIFYKNKKLKFIAKRIIDKYITINNININISFGISNAYVTAILSALLMITLSIIINYVTEDRIKEFKDEEKQDKYIHKNFKYDVEPIYNDKLELKINLNVKFTIQILFIIKEFIMYKSNLFVNNTNKYKVKES